VTASTASQPHKHSVLLVDDEPEILFSLKGLLRREFNLFTAESGKEALQILQDHPIHVVMTDQRMPEMTGVELMGRVRNEHPDAIRIVFTGYADIKAVIEAINNGGLFRYITKPWDPDDLIATLREAAAEYDRHVDRRVILDAVHDHIEQGRRLAEQLAAARGAPDPAALTQFRQTAEQLLARIRNITAT
jgi:response regulator RpfG family c-di-GMP phosphodiesterase